MNNKKSNSKFFPIPEVENVNTYVQNARFYGKKYSQKFINLLFNAGIKHANNWLKKNLPETIWNQIVSYFEKGAEGPVPYLYSQIYGRMNRTDKLVTDDPQDVYLIRKKQIVTLKKDLAGIRNGTSLKLIEEIVDETSKVKKVGYNFHIIGHPEYERLYIPKEKLAEYIDVGPSVKESFSNIVIDYGLIDHSPYYSAKKGDIVMFSAVNFFWNDDILYKYGVEKNDEFEVLETTEDHYKLKRLRDGKIVCIFDNVRGIMFTEVKKSSGSASIEDKDGATFFDMLHNSKTVEKKDLLDSMIKANDVNNDAPVGDKDVLVFKQSFFNCFRDENGRIDLDHLRKEVVSIFENYCDSEILAMRLGYTPFGPVYSLKDIYMGRKVYDSVYFDAFSNKNDFEEKSFKAGDVIKLKPGCFVEGIREGQELTLFKQENMLYARTKEGSVFFFDPLRDGGKFTKLKFGSVTYVGTSGHKGKLAEAEKMFFNDKGVSANVGVIPKFYEEDSVNVWGHYVGDVKHGLWPLMDNKVLPGNIASSNNSTGVNDIEIISKVIVTELSQIINKHSLENETNTPDFILGQMLYDCLALYDKIMKGQDKKILPTEITEMYDKGKFRDPFEKAILSRRNWYSVGDEQEYKEKEDSGYVPGRVGSCKFPEIDSVFKEAGDKSFSGDVLDRKNRTYVRILKDAYGLKKGDFCYMTYNVKTDEYRLTPVFNIDHETCLKFSQIEDLFAIVANPEIIFGPSYTFPKPPVNSTERFSNKLGEREVSILQIDFGLYYFTENNVIDTDTLGFDRKGCLAFKDKMGDFIYGIHNYERPMVTAFTDKSRAAKHLDFVYNHVVCVRENNNLSCREGHVYRIHFLGNVSVTGKDTEVVLDALNDNGKDCIVTIKDLICSFRAVLPGMRIHSMGVKYRFVEIPLENKAPDIEERFNYDEKTKASLINNHRNHTKHPKCKEIFFLKEDYEGLPKNTKIGLLGNKLSTMSNKSPMVVIETENITEIGRELRIPNNLLSKGRLS